MNKNEQAEKNATDKQLEEKLIEYIRLNEERKFTNTLGPAKSGENQLKHESLRRMSMFTNMTTQSKRSNEANALETKNWESVDFNKKNYDEFRLLTEMVRYERINFL